MVIWWIDEFSVLRSDLWVFEDKEDVLCPVTTLFPFWLLPFLLIWSSTRRGSNLLRVWIMLAAIVFCLCFAFVLFRCGFSMDQQSLDCGWLFSTSLFSRVMIVNAYFEQSFPGSNDRTRLPRDKHFSSKSFIALSFLDIVDNFFSQFFLLVEELDT